MNYKFGLKDVDGFNAFLQERDEFSFNTFGSVEVRTCIYPLRHLKKEVQELLDNPDDKMEWADCMLLLLDAARRKGYSIDDLLSFCKEKLAINRKRTWEKQEDGVFQHVKPEQVQIGPSYYCPACRGTFGAALGNGPVYNKYCDRCESTFVEVKTI